MDEEFVKILKECDAHSNEYVERLKDETRVSAIIDSLQCYIERQNLPAELCRLYARKIEHLYYKFDSGTVKAVAEVNAPFYFCIFIELILLSNRAKYPPIRRRVWKWWTVCVASSTSTIKKRGFGRELCFVIFTITPFMTSGTKLAIWCSCLTFK